MKKQIYNIIAHSGIWFLHKFFPEYFATEPLNPTDRYYEYPWILKNLPSPPATILDVGCSGSMFPLILQALKYKTYGIDIREYHPQHHIFFYKDNIEEPHLLHQAEFFNVITAISSIEHIGLKGVYGQQENMEGDIRAMKEIYRILKPNGLFLMTVPFGNDLRITMNHKIYNKERLKLLLWQFNWSLETIKSPEGDYEIAMIRAVKNG